MRLHALHAWCMWCARAACMHNPSCLHDLSRCCEPLRCDNIFRSQWGCEPPSWFQVDGLPASWSAAPIDTGNPADALSSSAGPAAAAAAQSGKVPSGGSLACNVGETQLVLIFDSSHASDGVAQPQFAVQEAQEGASCALQLVTSLQCIHESMCRV